MVESLGEEDRATLSADPPLGLGLGADLGGVSGSGMWPRWPAKWGRWPREGWGGNSLGEMDLTSKVAKIAKAANGATGARGHEDTERGDTAKAEGLWRRLATVR